jgi:thiamine kinase-like enzyme
MSLPDPINPTWLTRQLRVYNHLPAGHVVDLEIGKTRETTAAVLTPLTVSYSPGVSLPTRLIVKDYKAGWHWSGYSEEFFRRELAPQMQMAPLVPVFVSYTDMVAQVSYAIMADFRETHASAPEPLPENIDYARVYEPVIDVMADMHAHWWDHRRLDEEDMFKLHGGPLRMSSALNLDQIDQQVLQLRKEIANQRDWLMEDLNERQIQIFDTVLEHWPRIFGTRVSQKKNITLLHGDFHLWNLAFPIKSTREPVYLLDWETFKRGLGAYDLAYLIVFTESREFKSSEMRMMRRYHSRLISQGVSSYSWDEFLADYRISVMTCLFPALLWHLLFRDSHTNIEAAIEFYDRWNCDILTYDED